MRDDNKPTSMLSHIAYHDYVMLLCYVKSEWIKNIQNCYERKSCESLLLSQYEFAKSCYRYSDGLTSNFKSFCKANQEKLTTDKLPAPFLFNPIFYVPFGYGDNLAIVLLDDFDPVYRITSEVKTTLIEACLAFCPTVSSLCIDGSPTWLRDFDEVLGNMEAALPAEYPRRSFRKPAKCAIQDENPYLVFTRFKLHGLGAVGQGLLFQQAVYRAMVKKIESTLSYLDSRIADRDPNVVGLMEADDLGTVKIVLLDLQGAEEVGVLCFCRNYSTAISLVSTLRSLTFRDVFEADLSKKLKSLLTGCPAHRAIAQLYRSQKGEELENHDLLEHEYIFQWAYSTLGFSSQAFLEGNYLNCNGYVEAISEFRINPGRDVDVRQKVDLINTKLHGLRSEEYTGTREYYPYKIGTGDFAATFSDQRVGLQQPLVKMSRVIQIIKEFDAVFGRTKEKGDSGSDVIDILTDLTIPVPTIPKEKSKNFAILQTALLKIQQRLCYYSHLSQSEKKVAGEAAGKLDLDRLRNGHRKLGVPVSLRRTIEYVYHDFAIAIADPLIFDAILDLYDAFVTLCAVLSRHLPATREKELGRPKDNWLGLLDEERTEQLSLFAEAIDNAFTHRIPKAYPYLQVRDVSVDFRGAINQLLLAPDAAMKCGLGLLRRYVLADNRRETVGALMKVSFTPRAYIYSLNLGVENHARLAFFEVDPPHVLNIASHTDFLHESFHLIFDALRDNPELRRHQWSSISSTTDARTLDELGEIFANLLCHLFVYETDTDSFLFENIIDFSKNPIHVGSDFERTMERFSRVLIRLFLVVDMIPADTAPSKLSPVKCVREGGDTGMARKRFVSLLDDVFPFFPEFECQWWNRDKLDVERVCLKYFDELYPKLAKFMNDVWCEAVGIYMDFLKDKPYYQSHETYDKRRIWSDIDASFKEGKPLIRSLFLTSMKNVDSSLADTVIGKGFYTGYDPLAMICNMLHSYTATSKLGKGQAIHLYRDPATGNVGYPQMGGRRWFEFQIDKGATSMFCPVPSARRERLRKQIAVIKTLWDISSSLRERRLRLILYDNFPDLLK
jgi:hypothetical protein